MNNLQNNQKRDAHPMGYDTMLGVVVSSPKCAVKVLSSGEHCPETGIHKIDDTELPYKMQITFKIR